MKTKEFPGVPEELLKALEGLYPNRLPTDINVSIEDIRHAQGQQTIIAFLRYHFERQNKSILEKD